MIDSIKKLGVCIYPINSKLNADAAISKFSRLALAANVTGLNIIHDVDSVIFSKEYIDYIIDSYDPGRVTCVGREVYVGTEHSENFPMGMCSGTSQDFRSCLGLSGKIQDDIEYLIDFSSGLDPSISASVFYSETFSDESLFRELVHNKKTKAKCNHITRDPQGAAPGTWAGNKCLRRIKPQDWSIENIKSGAIEGNIILPLRDNLEQIKCVYQHLGHDNLQMLDVGLFNFKWGGSGIEKVTYEWFVNNIPAGSTVVEFGGGIVSSYVLSSRYDLHTVEQNMGFVLYQNPTYHFSPIKDGWYDWSKLQNLPVKPDCIFIDGPAGTGNRNGFLKYMQKLDLSETIIVLHDANREKEADLAKKIANKLNKTCNIIKLEGYGKRDHIAVIK